MTDNTPKVEVDSRRFLCVDGIKVGRVTPDGKLQLCDKDPRRSAQRGSRMVTVDPSAIKTAVDQATKPPPPTPTE